MIRVRPALGTDADAWQAFLGATESGDFLHDPAWAAVAAFDGEPQRRFIAEADGEIVAVVAAQVRRLPLGRSFWYVPHGPVLDYGAPGAGDRLRAVSLALREVARADRAVAVRLEPRLAVDDPALAAFDRLRLRPDPRSLQVGQTRLVELASDEEMLAAFDKDTRYAVRRSAREGVEVSVVSDPADLMAIDRLHGLVLETQRRAGFPMPSRERYRLVWRGLAAAGRAHILEARREGVLLASGMLVLEGWRSFYLFAGSLREGRGEPKRYATYALQWAMMRTARDAGARLHDLWGIAPPGAGPEHRWYGVGLFKKGFGGREVRWAGSWDIVVQPDLYRLRRAIGMARALPRRLLGR